MIGFIGFGRMGGALANGAFNAKVLKPAQTIAYDPEPAIKSSLKKSSVRAASQPLEVVEKADIVFLCMKPQGMREAVLPLSLQAAPGSLKKKCFVSIAAGITIGRLESWLGDGVAVFRVMPNTPALLGAGMSAISRGRFGTSLQEKRVKQILSSVGEVVSVSEKWMDAVTAVSGSGPAYVFYLAEAMIAGAERLGISKDVARMLVHQTVHGAGLMLLNRPEAAEELRRQVTSPGGTTAAAVAFFDKKNFKTIVQQAVVAAAKRSAELSKS